MSHGNYILYEKAKRCFGDYVFATHRMAPDLVRFGAEYERERAKVLVDVLTRMPEGRFVDHMGCEWNVHGRIEEALEKYRGGE